MTKYETISYYEAIGDAEKLICIDSSDTTKDVEETISKHVDEKSSDKFQIEIFHEEIGVQTYTMLRQGTSENGKSIFDLWTNMSKVLEKATIESVVPILIDNMPKTAKSPYTKYVDSVNPDGTYTIKSFSDPAFSETMNLVKLINYSQSVSDTDKILGEFDTDGKHYHAINHADTSVFDDILNKISSKAIRLYAETCLKIIPDYVFTEPASNDSYTRPASDLADGGLLRHLINTANLICHMTTLDYANIKFTHHEIDMMIVAAVFHDCLKYGWQEDYKKDRSEKFEHPRLAANALRSIRGIIPDNDIKFITNCIESHMGNNNTNPNDINSSPLPIPDTECKYMIHLADFLATRKDIIFVHNNTVHALSNHKINTVKDFTPISNAEKSILTNAIDMPVDMTIANELDIHREEKRIKMIWQHIIDTQRVTARQVKYIELAKRMTFY